MRAPIIDFETGTAFWTMGEAALFGKRYAWVKRCPLADLPTLRSLADLPLTLVRQDRDGGTDG